ncbi:MAG: ABC transporter ATP-binding protein [Vicinamibacterales bacterium]
MNESPLLEVRDLTTVFRLPDGDVRAVDGVSLAVARGETLALVGESGSGKSVTALSILGLVEPPGRMVGGSIRFEGRELAGAGDDAMRQVRGAKIALIFQEPASALNPVFTVGSQISEVIVAHGLASRRQAWAEAVTLLGLMRIPEPEERARYYPHQLSGGMRQRVAIAIALAARPALLIADEPTTALDVTIQAETLDLLRERKAASALSLLLITHDLGIVASMADRVAVMYAGRIVEQAPVGRLFDSPAHPYTRVLLASARGSLGEAGAASAGVQARAAGARVPGCAFAPRCAERRPVCDSAPPSLTGVGPCHDVRCYLSLPGGR